MLDREISIVIRVCGFVRKQQVRSLRYIEDKLTHACVMEVAGPRSFMYRSDTDSCSGSPSQGFAVSLLRCILIQPRARGYQDR